jgi:GNAT superfamily N-acetyltransferase
VLRVEHYDSIISVWERAGLPFKPRGRDSLETMKAQMALDPEMFLGCFIGGELVGVVVGSYDQRKAWVNRLAVVPEHRRKGIARALVNAVEEGFRERGFRIIATLVEGSTPESLELFLKSGYVFHDDIHYLTKRESDDV